MAINSRFLNYPKRLLSNSIFGDSKAVGYALAWCVEPHLDWHKK